MKYRLGKHDIKIAGDNFAQVLGEIQNDCYDMAAIDFNAGDVVLDIGAHIGLFSCYVAAHHPDVQIYAYEPAAKTYSYLTENIAPFSNITAYRLAVGSGEHEWLQYRCDKDFCSSSHYPMKLAISDLEKVRTLKLDEILTQHEQVKCLKLDCEGGEWDALLNSELLDEKVEYLRLELHHLPQYAMLKSDMKKRLKQFAGRNYHRLRINEIDKLQSEGLAA
ncbi:MAG: FkbM family methyltransferase [Rickettsiales bacterium]|jgi:FkbM family methyltransferase|nr:FkbM family methyltransferase [Rickettsiales bacterium]